MITWVSSWFDAFADFPSLPKLPVKVSTRTVGEALENALIGRHTRKDLEVILPSELGLEWRISSHEPADADTKRALVDGYISGFTLPALVALARRVLAEYGAHGEDLKELVDAYDQKATGVQGSVKNLIFAANGPKPDLVLRDAVNNDVEIAANSEFCLVYDRPVPDEGLTFRHLVDWWRKREPFPADAPDEQVAQNLHTRLRASLNGNGAEEKVFDAYGKRYPTNLDAPALIPQVYLHYDPLSQHARAQRQAPGPIARQRMDFLLLVDNRRIVIEVDGKQHYAEGDVARPDLYAQMVAEDRWLRLRGYDIYRFGGAELARSDSEDRVDSFFSDLFDTLGSSVRV